MNISIAGKPSSFSSSSHLTPIAKDIEFHKILLNIDFKKQERLIRKKTTPSQTAIKLHTISKYQKTPQRQDKNLEISFNQKVAFGFSVLSLACRALSSTGYNSFVAPISYLGLGFQATAAFQLIQNCYEGSSSYPQLAISLGSIGLSFGPLKPFIQGMTTYSICYDCYKQAQLSLSQMNERNKFLVARNIFVYAVNSLNSCYNLFETVSRFDQTQSTKKQDSISNTNKKESQNSETTNNKDVIKNLKSLTKKTIEQSPFYMDKIFGPAKSSIQNTSIADKINYSRAIQICENIVDFWKSNLENLSRDPSIQYLGPSLPSCQETNSIIEHSIEEPITEIFSRHENNPSLKEITDQYRKFFSDLKSCACERSKEENSCPIEHGYG